MAQLSELRRITITDLDLIAGADPRLTDDPAVRRHYGELLGAGAEVELLVVGGEVDKAEGGGEVDDVATKCGSTESI